MTSFNSRYLKFAYCLRIFSLFTILLIIFLQLYSVVIYHTEANLALPSSYGNFEHVRNLLDNDEDRKDFSFALAGDTRGTGMFERIADELRDEPLAFLVNLGDIVKKAREGYHAFLRAEAPEFNLPYPVFFVVGNHDFDESKFPLSRFEEVYGPTNTFFVYQDCLFVILRTLIPPHSNEESLKFIDDLLSQSAGKYRKTFVLTHIAPHISDDIKKSGFTGDQTLVDILDKYKVDYLIAGHHHGYARVKLKDTAYLVTGGAGSHLEREKYGRINHAMVLHVGADDSVSERMVALERSDDIEDRVERQIIAEIYPWMSSHRILVLSINVILLCLAVMLIRPSLKKRKSP